MKCQRCGKNLGDSSKCNFCGFENSAGNVREMTRTERNFYNGLTIDLSEPENNSRNKNYNRTYINLNGGGFFSRIFEKFIVGLLNNNLLAKIAGILIFVAFAALMFFIALPILFFILALGIALLIYARLKR